MNTIQIGIVGNPNCGKTTLFNNLTGARQKVGNWPGVTVDRKEGRYEYKSVPVTVVDTPGIYSLAATSLDEEIARGYVLSGDVQVVVNIVDASNIERNLYLTCQLLEMRVPMIVVLNMMDIAQDKQMQINVTKLEEELGCPVVTMVASRGVGLDTLKTKIIEVAEDRIVPTAQIEFPQVVKDMTVGLENDLVELAAVHRLEKSWLALKLLEGDQQICQMIGSKQLQIVDRYRETIESIEKEEADIVIASARYDYISYLTRECLTRKGEMSETVSDTVDRFVLNRFVGIPLFLVVMYAVFMMTINVGGAFIDFFDLFAGAIFVDGISYLLQNVSAPDWIVTVLANGIGGGVQTMATFIPPIGFMFLCLSFLEDSGYMARAAFVMDRFMRIIGLPGKAFVPMLVGFGCNVPAIMATRTLENERDRKLTIMMNPFMSCGARLPVYALFAAAFFPVGGQNLVFLLYLIGIGFAVLTGLVLKNTLLKGEVTPFVMELPPYHLPGVRTVILRAYERLTSFLFKAGKVLVPVIVVLSFLNSMGIDGSFGNEEKETSVLAAVSKAITPVFAPMGITEENWPATVGIFTGIFAKEAVVGTLDSLYAGIGEDEGKEDSSFQLGRAIADALATIPENLSGLAGTFLDPLGISVGDVSNRDTAAEEQEVGVGTFGSMVALFETKIAAFAYLLFILLYFPCSAAIAAVYRETNLAWTAFAGFWTTFLAYLASTLFYQVAMFSKAPAVSTMFIIGDILAFIIVFMLLKYLGGNHFGHHSQSTRPSYGTTEGYTI
ncbi:Fe(2+) transporter permease subunit FeoB [Desulfogranum japonicum]|uniref:Fe(2+) transporter permease subunit FeoB n=1 Tax=Desulfogranum japonicum TaxID=231447 RepID=UPI0003F92DB3|nr:Fe(2+) transporter permease subunit FeoB [Desulfogranum japonicum]